MSEASDFAKFRGEALLEAIRSAAGAARVGLAVTLPERVPPLVIYLNEQAEELLGRSRKEVETIGVWGCIAPEQRTLFQNRLGQRLRGDPPPNGFEIIVVRPDGERIPIELSHSETSIDGTKVIVSFLFDMRERQRTVLALKESEQRFRSVVENAPDGVVVLKGPKITFMNRRAAVLVGLENPEDGYGRSITEFLHPEDAARAGERIGRLFAQGAPFAEPAEYRSRGLNGKENTVEISSIPVELDGTRAVVAFARDVTERNAIQARLIQADRLAALGVLSAGVAHEINNPLAYVLLNLEYLERELPKLAGDSGLLDPLLARVRDAVHGAERVATIVRDLRTFARGDEGARGPVRLSRVIEAAFNIAQAEIHRRARIVRIYEEVPPVEGNANRLEQVFLNLILNAAQSIEEGSPESNEIRVGVKRIGDTVFVEFRDTGSGMSEDVKSRIFDPFFTTKPPGVGTGLGLPICQSIVRAHGGELSVESHPGKGSLFTVALPAWAGEAQLRTPIPPRAPEANGPRGRVMIVDDEVAVGRTLSLVLSSEHDVTVVNTAQEALSCLEREGAQGFDAVLCDLVMPVMSGFDLFQAIQKLYPELAPRVIFMTGGITTQRPRNLTSLPNALFEKPFDLDQIRKHLRAVVDAHVRSS